VLITLPAGPPQSRDHAAHLHADRRALSLVVDDPARSALVVKIRHSAMQAAGIALMLPIWEKNSGAVPVGAETLVTADYGSSQERKANESEADDPDRIR